MSGATGPIL
ncbi:hypothetical protein AVEN_218846-1, partial [Araneus ventricosus]